MGAKHEGDGVDDVGVGGVLVGDGECCGGGFGADPVGQFLFVPVVFVVPVDVGVDECGVESP